MASRPSPGTSWARFVLYQQGDIKEFSNDFWYSITAGSVTPPYDYFSAIGAFLAAIVPALVACQAGSIIVRGAYGEFNDGTGTIGVDNYSSSTGGGVDAPIPEDVALIVQKITSTLSRSARGRWYFTGIDSSQVNGSYLQLPIPTIFQTLATALKTAFTSGSVTFSPAHFSPNTGLLYPITDTPIVALLGTKRRRRGPF
jgi:hypothetical protein